MSSCRLDKESPWRDLQANHNEPAYPLSLFLLKLSSRLIELTREEKTVESSLNKARLPEAEQNSNPNPNPNHTRTRTRSQTSAWKVLELAFYFHFHLAPLSFPFLSLHFFINSSHLFFLILLGNFSLLFFYFLQSGALVFSNSKSAKQTKKRELKFKAPCRASRTKIIIYTVCVVRSSLKKKKSKRVGSYNTSDALSGPA